MYDGRRMRRTQFEDRGDVIHRDDMTRTRLPSGLAGRDLDARGTGASQGPSVVRR
jgi:hypothetical protein